MADRETLIKELASLSNFKDNVDAAIYAFTLLCVSNLYKVVNPYDIIERDIKYNFDMREPRAFLYYIIWVNTGKTHKQIGEMCKNSDTAMICKMINNIKSNVRRVNSDISINASNVNARVEKFKNVIRKELSVG